MTENGIKPIDLSVVIPTVDSATRIEATLHEVVYKLSLYKKMCLVRNYEVLPVAQTSSDDTFAVLHRYDAHRIIKPSYLVSRGKGLACSFGMAKAVHEWVMLFDDDLNYQMNFLIDAIPICSKYDIVIAARIGRQHMPLARRVASWSYRKLAHWLFGLHGINDIQAGQKLIRKSILCSKSAEPAHLLDCSLIHLAEHGFVWDTELLYKAKSHGRKICELPIVYQYKESVLRLSRAWLDMGLDLLRLRWRTWKD